MVPRRRRAQAAARARAPARAQARAPARTGGAEGTGGRRFLYVFTRERGTSARNVRAYVIHRNCVPTEVDAPAGIPARRVSR